MKRLISILAIALCICSTQALDKYKIMYLSPSPLVIGDKEYNVGDIIDGSVSPKWLTNRQAVKLKNLRTLKQERITAEQFTKSGKNNLSSFIIQTKTLGVRSGKISNIMDLNRCLSDTFYLIDTIEIPIKIPTDENHFFYASYEYNGEIINKRLRTNNGKSIIFNRDIFSIDNVAIKPFDVTLSVYYYNNYTGKTNLISQDMLILVSD